MNVARRIAFVAGIAALVALTVYAGAGSVLRALAALEVWGLALVALIHLPVLALLSLAWWSVARPIPNATYPKLLGARFVRDAVGEVLPFSQAGGYLAGLRVLSKSGVRALPAALSMSVDLVVELWAKVPYIVAGLGALLMTTPQSQLLRPLAIALILTIAACAAPVLLRGRLWTMLQSLALRLAKARPEIGTIVPEQIAEGFGRLFADRGRLLAGFGIHLLCWFVGAAELWVILALMGARNTGTAALAIDSLVSALRSFAFLVPAAAGVQEASFVLIGGLFGISPATAIALSLVRRARDLVIGVPAIAAWQYWEARPRPRQTGRA